MKEFYKYHGAGNDFIMIDNLKKNSSVIDVNKIKLLCDRHFGIGADGLILLESSDKADCFMNYYNADGTAAEMCGNGVRCVARFFMEQTKSKPQELSIDTRTGIKKVICNADGSFSVNMGAPAFSHPDFPNIPLMLENILFEFVSMGNPHAVGMVKNINEVDISLIGPKIENDSHFPNKINIELVEKIVNDHFRVKVWERGSGATLSCGSGACAVYAILKKENRNIKQITLEFPGGNLILESGENRNGSPKDIWLTGPTKCVFKGKMES